MKLLTMELTHADGEDKITWASAIPPTEALDRLIALLGPMRASMQPPVQQEDPIPGTTIHTEIDPRVALSMHLNGDLLWSVRHPGFGWLHFQLPPETVVRLQPHIANALVRNEEPKH